MRVVQGHHPSALSPNIIVDPNQVMNLPGRRSRVVQIDPRDGSKVEIIQNEGQL